MDLPIVVEWNNERNNRCCDIMLKKLSEEKKTQFNDSLVKVAAWTHKTNANKLGYATLQIVTGKLCSLPGLTIGNEATKVFQIQKQYRR